MGDMNDEQPTPGMIPTATNPTGLLLVIGLAVWSILVFTFLRDLGQALVEWASGVPVTAFDLGFLNQGTQAGVAAAPTDFQTGLRSVAGLVFPLLVWAGFMLVVPRRASAPLEALKWMVSAVLIVSMLAWVILPVFFQENQMAVSDDVTLFLSITGINGYLAALIFGGLVVAAYRLARARISSPGLVRELVLGQGEEMDFSAYRRFYIPVIAAGLALLAFNLALGGLNRSGQPQGEAGPPPGYQFIREIQLSGQANQDLPVIAFNHTSANPRGIFIRLRDVQAGQISLRLAGPDGYSRNLLDLENYTSGYDTVLFEESLEAGQYQVLLTSQKSPGSLSFYTRGR